MEDHGAVIKIVSWFLLIVSSGAVVACLLTSWHLLGRKILVLTLLLSTLLSSAIAGATVSIAATRGLGRPLSEGSLTEDQLAGLQIAIYVTEISHVLTLGLGKLSFIALFYMVLSGSALTTLTRAIFAVGTFLILWTLTTVLAVAFQCHPPEVWNLMSGRCLDVTALWTYYGAMNIIIETLLFTVPSVLIYRLRMRLRKRLVVIGCLSVRTLDILVSAVQLQYVHGFDPSPSLPSALYPWMLCSQVLQTVAIVATCVPYLREFLESFPSGMLKPAGVERTTGLRYGSGSTRLLDSDSGASP
ncbi:uncharacterized protein BO97DRAFT_398567 [Aspergillus homomorphus CBS 101889]|uniref:Rhodopsin domain-containing protein n=1 Tax=Aspergillus homomorphus (strain CBS 101889) TaxID=1450537 RepID=A0A395HL93_ASPHC|nr:hypothetical protein BO97DRAFT_398567 [Aspergillus homomorphus CBS 101889]RAL08249.1 hypothetical protein BO97DRAFT_398567 [Aspergillus homomorphus CBS 101889]